MLRLASCLEEHYPHSIANAVVRAAKKKHLEHDEMHAKVEDLVAHGIATTVNEWRVIIGSHHFVFEDEGCVVPGGEREKFQMLPREYSHLYLAIREVLAAVICVSDPLRPEATQAMKQLRTLGVSRLVMITGDDVGIAISDGAAIAREIADITIAADNLFELGTLRQLAQRLMWRIDHSYRFIMGVNGGLIALGALGILPPATLALLHNASTLLVSLKSMTHHLGEQEI